MRTERLGDDKNMALLILQPGDSLRCDDGEIPVLIEAGMKYTITPSVSPKAEA